MKTNSSISPVNIVFPRGYKVCVATAFNPNGDIRIDAWGIEFNGKRFKYKVQEATLINEVTAYMKFRCVYAEFGLLKSINLIYYLREHRWTTE